MRAGVVEIASQDFVSGWAADDSQRQPAHVCATLDGRVLGFARADIKRRDLEALASGGELFAHAFLILFDHSLPEAALARIEVRSLHGDAPAYRNERLRIDRSPQMRIFVLGSPRSGTSELAATLADVFALPWLGEGHSPPQYAAAAEALTGDSESANALPRFMAQQNLRKIAVDAVRRSYYFMHGSASFLDKTPGVPMIKSAAFLTEAFPDARFIYVQRNGISNVLSRMIKFGGSFDRNCADWAASVTAWSVTRKLLPHSLEIRQEDMLARPGDVATQIAAYLNLPESAEPLATRLASGTRERTGAGIGRVTLDATGWNGNEIAIFRRICSNAMLLAGYETDGTSAQISK
jgi:hypothetical protein